MKYTKEQLAGMSDFEVNKTLAELIGLVITGCCGEAVACGYDGLQSTFRDRDYCINPNDIMPLAFEHDIAYVKSSECAHHQLQECTYGFDCGQYCEDKNPLRAIACCLILVLQDKRA